MSVTVQKIIEYLEELAPPSLAMPDDPVGLQVGRRDAPVSRVLVALDPDEAALWQAGSTGAELVVTHHPLLYRPINAVDENRPAGALVAGFIRKEINVYSAHTNLDVAPRGLSHRLADLLGFPSAGRRVIEVTGYDPLLKLVVFVPRGHEDAVRDALAEAGAGWIGNYSHCTFQAPGTGTFMPREGTDPFIGKQGNLEKVDEWRLETVLPRSRRRAVLEALLASHPYEEVAYDLYALDLPGEPYGLGLAVRLDRPLTLAQILARCREALNPAGLRWWAPDNRKEFTHVAVCSGSGGSLVEQAVRQGVELFISGDFRYHDLKAAQSAGMGLVDAGHDGTEYPAVGLLAEYLQERLAVDGHTTVVERAVPTSPGWKEE